MLVVPNNEGALAIGQLSHSWLSGQLASAWGNDRFGAVEPRDEIVLGACQHDIGWAGPDLEPRLIPETGLPRGFLETTPEEHLAIWRDAPRYLLSQSLYAALVVSLHGAALSELRATSAPGHAAPLQAHVQAERARQRELCELLGVSAPQAERLQRQMWAWDGLSLALCHGWLPFTVRGVPTVAGSVDVELRRRGRDTFAVDPWPFARERVEVRCEARRLEGRYEQESALRRALAEAAPVALTFALLAP